MFSADVDLATLQTLKKLTNFLGVHKIGFSKKYLINTDFFENFSFNIGLDKISQADFCFLVGTNPRYEASALNLKLKKCFNTGFLNIASLGVPFNLFYTTSVLGVASDVIIKIAEGKHSFCKKFRRSNTPLIILGGSISERYDFFGLQKAALKIRKSATFSNNKWNPFCFLVQEANQYGGFFLGLNDHSCIKKEDFLILNGNLKKEDFYNKELSTGIIFLGSHGSDLLLKACLVLPIKAYLEANGFFMNALVSVQKVEKVSKGPNLARENSKVFENILSSSYTAGVDTKFAPSLISKDIFQKSGFSNIFVEKKRISGKSIISRNPFLPKVTDFYLSGSVSKFSLIMAKCSKMYRAQFKNFFATN
jgi:NADH-quinone oxidoreductase subunit G